MRLPACRRVTSLSVFDDAILLSLVVSPPNTEARRGIASFREEVNWFLSSGFYGEDFLTRLTFGARGRLIGRMRWISHILPFVLFAGSALAVCLAGTSWLEGDYFNFGINCGLVLVNTSSMRSIALTDLRWRVHDLLMRQRADASLARLRANLTRAGLPFPDHLFPDRP